MESADQETVDIIAGQQHSIDTLMKRMADMEKTLNSAKRECEKIPEIERRIECIGNAFVCDLTDHRCLPNSDIMYPLGSTSLRLFKTGIIKPDKIGFFYKLQSLRFENINDKNFIGSNPIVKQLHLNGCSTSIWGDLTIIREYPKLEEIYISLPGGGFQPGALENLKSIPHKLKKISLTGVLNANMLQSYCDKNSIELVIA